MAEQKFAGMRIRSIEDVTAGKEFEDPKPFGFSPQLWGKLFEFKWRDISFPVANVRVEITNDMVQHTRPGQDSGFVEGMGRRPFTISATCLFRNGISPAPTESWEQPLYPKVYTQFLAAVADQATGPLQHPSLGIIQAKALSAASTMSAERRDGEDVEVQWVETLTNEPAEDYVFGNRYIEDIGTAAALVDSYVIAFFPNNELKDPEFPDNFLDMVTQVTAMIDSGMLAVNRITGFVNRVIYRCDRLIFSLHKIATPQTWPVLRAMDNMKSSALFMKEKVLYSRRIIKKYRTLAPMSFASVAIITGNTVEDIIKLNRHLHGFAVFPANTLVNYYWNTFENPYRDTFNK